MLAGLSWLALEVVDLDRARDFYAGELGLAPAAVSDRELRFPVRETTLVLRRPRAVPRGGLHTHFAFTTPAAAYDDWTARLRAAGHDLEEVSFGSYRSLYLDDPDGHCVEIGGADPGNGNGNGNENGNGNGNRTTADSREGNAASDAPPLTGIFEVVLEVAALDRAVALYRALGFAVTDRGENRRRVRLGGPFDLELWEPQLGIADARGGVHVDIGITADDPDGLADRVASRVRAVETVPEGVRLLDPDGHRVTLVGGGA